LEDEIFSLREEENKREEIMTSHLKERYEDLNKIEVEFSEQETRPEEEIISLKTQLEETKRTKEVMKVQMKKKEEDCEKLEEEVVSLRVEVENIKRSQVLEDILIYQRSPFNKVGLGYIGETLCKEDGNSNPSKSVEERGSSNQPVKKFEEKCYRFLERNNEDKDKSHVEVIKVYIKKEE
jgi:hypothetical protein